MTSVSETRVAQVVVAITLVLSVCIVMIHCVCTCVCVCVCVGRGVIVLVSCPATGHKTGIIHRGILHFTGNETEISYFNWEDYKRYKANPQMLW